MMIYAAFTLGFLGSLHCLGMCGPIVFALPVRTQNIWLKVVKYFVYNFGRVLTYALLGLFMGIIGKGFVSAGIQQIVAISSGIFIILSTILVRKNFNIGILMNFSIWIKEKLKSAFRYYFKKTGVFSLFILGMLNGLLPCGMVYIALLGAISSGNHLSGSLFMAAFGMGTVPMMMSISLTGSMVGDKFKKLFFKATPVIACLVGGLLILRGLNLDIPYVSPGVTCCQTHTCH